MPPAELKIRHLKQELLVAEHHESNLLKVLFTLFYFSLVWYVVEWFIDKQQMNVMTNARVCGA